MSFMKASLVTIPIIVLLFCYQNCQKPPYADEINSANTVNQNVQNPPVEQKIIADIDEAKIQNLVFTERMPVQMNHSGKTFTLLDLVQFSIDWQSGVVQQLTSQNQVLGKYCLNKESLSVLKGLLSTSQVCEYRNAAVSNQVCAQMIVPGYMKLFTSAGEVEVGSQSDSCGTSRTDFCDDRGTSLKDWFNEFKKNLASLSCT